MSAYIEPSEAEAQKQAVKDFWASFRPVALYLEMFGEKYNLSRKKYHVGAQFNIVSGITVIAVGIDTYLGLHKFVKTTAPDDAKYLLEAGFVRTTISPPAVSAPAPMRA